MGHLWSSYGFDMGHYPPYQTVTERSHIIPIEKASEADEPLLWNIYGPCVGHNLPYQTHTFSLVRVIAEIEKNSISAIVDLIVLRSLRSLNFGNH